jgi:hypothetical protein
VPRSPAIQIGTNFGMHANWQALKNERSKAQNRQGVLAAEGGYPKVVRGNGLALLLEIGTDVKKGECM